MKGVSADEVPRVIEGCGTPNPRPGRSRLPGGGQGSLEMQSGLTEASNIRGTWQCSPIDGRNPAGLRGISTRMSRKFAALPGMAANLAKVMVAELARVPRSIVAPLPPPPAIRDDCAPSGYAKRVESWTQPSLFKSGMLVYALTRRGRSRSRRRGLRWWDQLWWRSGG